MVKTIVTLLLMVSFCFAEEMKIEQIESDQIEYKGKKLILTGHVHVLYTFGSIHCDKASLDIAKGKALGAGIGADMINLEGNVVINFPDGDKLEADKADLNCVAMEGVFYADEPKKVTYYTTMDQGTVKAPIKASSKKLRAKLSKEGEGSGYHLADLQGEGSVFIEYVKPKVEATKEHAE